MLEVGADARAIEQWVEVAGDHGFAFTADTCTAPTASLEFMRKTFGFIDSGEPHIIASAFCFGREDVIPRMFSKLASQLNLTQTDCPKFHYYLDRHIQLDGDEHGPAAIELVESLCNHDPVKIHEAEQAAIQALKARIKLWDDVAYIIQHESHLYSHS
jgi:hypothetical protein